MKFTGGILNEKSVELMVGSQAPDFRLMASDGREVGLDDFRAKSNVYLFFIREFN
jgi:peroxiredoxin